MIRIRKAMPEDAEGIARIHVDAWRATYEGIMTDEHLASLSYESGTAKWKTDLSKPDGTSVFVAELDSHVVGFAACGPVRDSERYYSGELYAIYVSLPMQRKGAGSLLSLEVARTLRSQGDDSMLVWVLAQNPSRVFYEWLGGEHVRTREVVVGGKMLTEWGYGWKNIDALIAKLEETAKRL